MEGIALTLAGSMERAPWGWALTAMIALALIKVWPAIKKMGIDEGATIRAEYVAEIKALREEVQNLRKENDGLRTEIRELHDLMAGMRRQNLQDQASMIRHVPAMQEAVGDVAVRAVKAANGDAK